MTRYLFLIVLLVIQVSPTALYAQTTAIETLARQAAQGDAKAISELTSRAYQGDPMAQSALKIIAGINDSNAGRLQHGSPTQNTAAMQAADYILSNPRLKALLPPGSQQAILKMSRMEKDPNMEAEYQHILYWMGEYRRCQVRTQKRQISVMGVMVMLEKAYSQFKPILPSLESLLMLAALPRTPTGSPEDQKIILLCRKREPIPILEWAMTEVYRYRASQVASR